MELLVPYKGAGYPAFHNWSDGVIPLYLAKQRKISCQLIHGFFGPGRLQFRDR